MEEYLPDAQKFGCRLWMGFYLRALRFVRISQELSLTGPICLSNVLRLVSRLNIAACCFCLAFGNFNFASAQQPIVIPREQLSPQFPTSNTSKPDDLAIERDQVPRLGPEGPTILLRDLELEGSTIYSAGQIRQLLDDYIGAEVGFDEVREIASLVEGLYEQDGFFAVRVVVPEQRIDDGKLRLVVIEGTISEIAIIGEAGSARPAFEAILAPLKDSSPIRRSALERSLLLARDVPGTTLISTLQSLPNADRPGELRLTVNVEHAPFDGFASVNNFASDEAGPYLGSLGVAGNSLVFAGDRAQLVLLSSAELGEQYLGLLSYLVPTSLPGLYFSVSVTNSLSEPGDVLASLDVDYRALIGRVGLDYDLVRSRDYNLRVGLGLEAVRQRQNADFAALAVDEDLRVLEIKARFAARNFGFGDLDASASLRGGLDGLGASDANDPGVTGDPQFLSFSADATYSIPVVDRVGVTTRVIGLVSTGNLPSYEALSFGNFTLGRGFEPGAATGDKGFGGSLELSFETELELAGWVDRHQLYGFFDGGIAVADGRDAALASAGLGMRFSLLDHIETDIYLAHPVAASELVPDDGWQALFQTTARF